jgi:hypothetical protein
LSADYAHEGADPEAYLEQFIGPKEFFEKSAANVWQVELD